MKTFYLNKTLGWRVEQHAIGWKLFNQFGYAGTFATLKLALAADAAQSGL